MTVRPLLGAAAKGIHTRRLLGRGDGVTRLTRGVPFRASTNTRTVGFLLASYVASPNGTLRTRRLAWDGVIDASVRIDAPEPVYRHLRRIPSQPRRRVGRQLDVWGYNSSGQLGDGTTTDHNT